jgi:hypothetical protein
MNKEKQLTNPNDFAVAKSVNQELIPIITLVKVADLMDLPLDYKIEELNRAYVLLVHELETLYDRNTELAAIRPEPFWKRFDVLKTLTGEIIDYLNDSSNDMGQAHIARVDKLCIIAGIESAELSPELKKLIKQTSEITADHLLSLDQARLDRNQEIEESWYIPEYKINYKPDGTILINDVLKLKKTQIGSTIDKLLEQAIKNPEKLFIPELPKTARNISTVLSSAGFTPTLRELFFPAVSSSKGVFFRPKVTYAQASEEDIDTTMLDLQLMALDADHTFSA